MLFVVQVDTLILCSCKAHGLMVDFALLFVLVGPGPVFCWFVVFACRPASLARGGAGWCFLFSVVVFVWVRCLPLLTML